MRKLASIAALLLAAWVSEETFPAPLIADRAVSDVVAGPAAGAQSAPRVATNGDVALLVWVDMRGGSYSVYCARVDASGNVLDPFGVPVAEGYSLSSVNWDGDAFVVIVGTTLARLSPDLASITTRQLDTASMVLAAATTGVDTRFLFLEPYTGRGAIIDSRGNVVSRPTLWTPAVTTVAAGANDDSFLILLEGTKAVHVDRNGNVLSTVGTGLAASTSLNGPMRGDAGGFLLLSLDSSAFQQVLRLYCFNASGVLVSRSDLADNILLSAFDLARDGDGYLAAWMSNDAVTQSTTEHLAGIGAGGSITPAGSATRPGRGSGIALASSGGRRFVATSEGGVGRSEDVFVQLVPDVQHLPPQQLVSASAPAQSNPAVASGDNGYAVAWMESGPDALVHGYVRRFAEDGAPQDDAPISLFAVPDTAELYATRPAIVSNGATYLVGWETSRAEGFVARRLGAVGGDWLDPKPFTVGLDDPGLASNGFDAVAFGRMSCGSNSCLAARRIAMSGDALESPVVTLRAIPAQQYSGNVRIRSNGTEYLALWTEDYVCLVLCGALPAQLYATRLRADGTAIDAAPLRLNGDNQYALEPTLAASADGRYLVAWDDADGLHGTRVTAEGAVEPSAILVPTPPDFTEIYRPTAAALAGQFVLLLRHSKGAATTLEGLTFATNADLTAVAAIPRMLLLPGAAGVRTVAAATNGSHLAVTYDRLGGMEAGGVPRAFLRLFAEPIPRRRPSR